MQNLVLLVKLEAQQYLITRYYKQKILYKTMFILVFYKRFSLPSLLFIYSLQPPVLRPTPPPPPSSSE
jgi:hypothetical protein